MFSLFIGQLKADNLVLYKTGLSALLMFLLTDRQLFCKLVFSFYPSGKVKHVLVQLGTGYLCENLCRVDALMP